ncbi:MAG: DUF3422 family protein [Rhizobiaceae bacterium]|nr:DUF3422 family protein [Rhizobiaceae bacterium]
MTGLRSDDTATANATSNVLSFPAYHARSFAIGEVHSRPHPLLSAPRLLVQLAFVTEGGATVDHAVLAELCRRQGVPAPDRDARHYIMRWGRGTLYWERHSEFSTYMWEAPLSEGGKWKQSSPFGEGFNPPGPVMSGVRLEIHKAGGDKQLAAFDLDPESMCHSLIEDGKAEILTDFRQDGDGLTRLFVVDHGLTEARTGALAQRLIEIETYRVFCMLGLPLAQSLSGQLRRMEDSLAELTNAIRNKGRHESEELLGHLTELAAELEAQAASSLFRFGASRAYYEIVTERLEALKEKPHEGGESWATFLTRRVAPAMRTCRSVEDRQANLSRRLTRATQLLRTWVDVEVEKQNRDLLASMNNRARQQLRLQQTVEGLSVAAISYYVVGLISYMVGGLPILPQWLQPKTAISVSVPLVILALWLVMWRIRRSHRKEADTQ